MLMFFVSCAVLIGIVALLPAYLSSYSLEKNSIKELDKVQKNKESRGINAVIKELEQTDKVVKKLKDDDVKNQTSSIIEKILTHRTPSIIFSSLQVTNIKNATSSAEVIIQGVSSTRETLLTFKKSLEMDPEIYDIEMPISDLAKGKNSDFAIKLQIKK